MKEADLQVGAAAMLRKYIEVLLGNQVRLCKRGQMATATEAERKAELAQIARELGQNRDYLKGLFEQLMQKEITQQAFAERKKAYEAKVRALNTRATRLETSARRLDEQIQECRELADCMSQVVCKYDLTVELIDKYVEKILVWHDKSYEIVWRFAQPFGGMEAAG